MKNPTKVDLAFQEEWWQSAEWYITRTSDLL